MSKLKIIYKNPDELIPYENNPRNIAVGVNEVAKSISKFGFKIPIIIDKDNVIVAGHTRLEAVKQLKLDEVPCIVADDLTESQIKAFRLADNKVAEFSGWDFDKLNAELKELSELDVDMSDFGFAALDISLDVNDDDFLQDTEITRSKEGKTVTCPHCGKEFEI